MRLSKVFFRLLAPVLLATNTSHAQSSTDCARCSRIASLSALRNLDSLLDRAYETKGLQDTALLARVRLAMADSFAEAIIGPSTEFVLVARKTDTSTSIRTVRRQIPLPPLDLTIAARSLQTLTTQKPTCSKPKFRDTVIVSDRTIARLDTLTNLYCESLSSLAFDATIDSTPKVSSLRYGEATSLRIEAPSATLSTQAARMCKSKLQSPMPELSMISLSVRTGFSPILSRLCTDIIRWTGSIHPAVQVNARVDAADVTVVDSILEITIRAREEVYWILTVAQVRDRVHGAIGVLVRDSIACLPRGPYGSTGSPTVLVAVDSKRTVGLGGIGSSRNFKFYSSARFSSDSNSTLLEFGAVPNRLLTSMLARLLAIPVLTYQPQASRVGVGALLAPSIGSVWQPALSYTSGGRVGFHFGRVFGSRSTSSRPDPSDTCQPAQRL